MQIDAVVLRHDPLFDVVVREEAAAVMHQAPSPSPQDTRARVQHAAIRCLVSNGIAGASMSAIAAEAGVSKALLHYHFTDRAQLLAEVVTAIGRRLMTREEAVFGRAEAGGAVDLYWQWVDEELHRGELRALLAMGTIRDASVRAALGATARRRHVVATSTIAEVFERLGLVPRVPASLIAGTCLVFVDGLAVTMDPTHDRRASFDVFWLAVLSLAK